VAERVLHLLGPSTGGIRRHVGYLADRLPAHGWEATVAGPAGVMGPAGRQDHAVAVPGPQEPWRLVPAGRALAGLLDGVDLLHAHGLKAGWLASTVRHRPPLVVTVHNAVIPETAGRLLPMLRRFERTLPKRCDAVIAVSDDIATRLGAANVVVVPPAGPPPAPDRSADEVRRMHDIGSGELLAVAVARLHPQKDLPMFLGGVASARARGVPVRAVIVGEGPEESALRAHAATLGIADAVAFTGPRPNAADELAAADVVVVSSRWESGPLVLLEAMLLGRPVISTPVGLAEHVVVPGETGVLVPVGDVRALAEALAVVHADPVGAAARAAAGRELVAGRYGGEVLVSRVVDVYRATLSP
jgi:glycosyltransferase involved in cell wall biosynthesis